MQAKNPKSAVRGTISPKARSVARTNRAPGAPDGMLHGSRDELRGRQRAVPAQGGRQFAGRAIQASPARA